jgi:hypothetical protein
MVLAGCPDWLAQPEAALDANVEAIGMLAGTSLSCRKLSRH